MLTAESAAKTLGVERGPGAYVNVALIAKLHLTTNVAFLLTFDPKDLDSMGAC